MDDLELKDIGGFTGTIQYTKIPTSKTVLTEGVCYIMQNGYSWFVTDMLPIIDAKFSKEDFLAVKLKLKDGKATATIEDGNNKVLYTQEYEYSDAKKELTLFWQNNVIMLSNEY